jgi:hypothetical protein
MGGDVADSVQSSLIMGKASLMGSYGASRIGGAFHAGNLDPFSQHVLHAAVGAGTALITGGDPLSGAGSAPWWAKLWQAPTAMAPLVIPP